MQLEVGANENPFALLVDADKMSREKARQKDSTQCQEHISCQAPIFSTFIYPWCNKLSCMSDLICSSFLCQASQSEELPVKASVLFAKVVMPKVPQEQLGVKSLELYHDNMRLILIFVASDELRLS